MKIKIISDGTMLGTKIVDEETGKELSFVRKVEWTLDLNAQPPWNRLATCKLEMFNVPVELVGEAEITKKDLPKDDHQPTA